MIPIAVPLSGPLFAGHFPGRPILPGVVLLDLALRAHSGGGASPAVREIATLRLRRLCAPGDVLEVEMLATDATASTAGGRIRFEIRRAAEVVANGVVVLGEPSPGAARAAPALDPRRASGVPDLDRLLPHRPPMRMVVGIEAESDAGVTCAVRIPDGNAFAEGGSAPALVTIEMAAQSAALFEALRRFREAGEAGPRVGYLVGARDVRFARARVPAGETLIASVRLTGMAPPLSTYAFEIATVPIAAAEVATRSEVITSGTLSTWLTATGA